MNRFFAFVFHLLIFISYLYTITFYEINVIPKLDVMKSYGGRWKFLTYWDVCFQCFFFGYCVMVDLTASQRLKNVRDKLFAGITFPAACFVCVAFWGIYAVDRDLIYPEYLDKIQPSWVNHQMHTNIVLFALLEMYFFFHRYPSKRVGLFMTLGFGLVYQIWILYLAFGKDIWVYGVLQVLSWPGRLLFFAICWVQLAAFYFSGQYLSSTFWRGADKQEVKAKKMS